MNFEKMFTTIDIHVAGEAFRIIIHSPIAFEGGDIKEKQNRLSDYRNERKLLLNEPRGHRGMNGCIVVPSAIADYGLLFLDHHSEVQFKYSGLVATITALLETGNLGKKDNNIYQIETFNGIYSVEALMANQEVVSVSLENRISRIVDENAVHSLIEVDHKRNYLVSRLPKQIPEISLDHLSAIQNWGREAVEKYSAKHTDLYGVIITEFDFLTENKVKSVTFEADGIILRSPGFDSTFAIYRAFFENGNVHSIINESIFGSVLTAELIDKQDSCYQMETEGFTTGMHQFIYDQDDPLKEGFLLK